MKEKIKKYFPIFFPIIIGTLVGLIISKSIDYNNLIKPPFSPPGILFPIAWTIIYLLMGISYYIVKDNLSDKEKTLYYAQLAVNALWSIIFFTLKWYLLSVLWIILLDILVITMILIFYRNNKLSAYLQIPYLLWILFATYLNIGIYLLN